MVLMRLSTPEFRLGFMVGAHGMEIHFGWIGFMWLWKKAVLDTVPSMGKDPCKDCGAPDWDSCNIHPDGGFYQCNKCTVFVPTKRT